MKSLLPFVAALALSLPLASQAQTAPAKKKATTTKAAPKKATAKKPAAKKSTVKTRNSRATVTRAVEATTPVESPSVRLTDAEQALAQRVYTGKLPCELGASVDVASDAANPGFFHVQAGNQRFYMHPVESKTGAIRLEDPRAGAVWLQLGNTSMLMNQKKGERIADDCKAPAQVSAAEEMARRPAGPGLFDAPAAAPARP